MVVAAPIVAVVLALVAAFLAAPAAHAEEIQCKSGYTYLDQFPLRRDNNEVTEYRVAIFRKNTGTRLGAVVWKERSRKRFFVKISIGGKKIVSDAGRATTRCVTARIEPGETALVYSSVAKRKGAKKIASNRLAVDW